MMTNSYGFSAVPFIAPVLPARMLGQAPVVAAFLLPQVFEAKDLDMLVTATLDEQAFVFEVSSIAAARNRLTIEFSKGLAVELRDWLNDVLED